MDDRNVTLWEDRLAGMARRFPYPPTPQLSAALPGRPTPAVRRATRRLGWVAAALTLLLLGALAVPQTRAALLTLVGRVGAIRVFVDETAPTPLPPAAPTSTPDRTGSLVATPPAIAPATSVAHSLTLRDLGEPVTPAEARRNLAFPLQLPGALGEPDEVYEHRTFSEPAVTLVWRDAARPNAPPITLTEIGVAEFAFKMVHEQRRVRETTVHDLPALWVEGPHSLQIIDSWTTEPLRIESNVLLWAADGVTFRLESDLSLEEALAIAESVAIGTAGEE